MAKSGLIAACLLDGKGGGKAVGWGDVRRWTPDEGLLWVHLDYTASDAQEWLVRESGVDDVTAEALLEEDTRPRSVVLPNGLLVCLRGVNMNPGADPEDMVAIRFWVEEKRVITLRHRRLLSADVVRRNIEQGTGPTTTGELLVDLAERLTERMSKVIEGIDETVDELEERVLTEESPSLRTELGAVRRDDIALRRYLAPQRTALTELTAERVPWLSKKNRNRLREEANRVMRYVEDLDAARERAGVTQEELDSKLSEQTNNRMYVLSLIAGVFLPITFITGLLGVNVGGIPGAENPWAFLTLTLILIVITVFGLVLFKNKRWL